MMATSSQTQHKLSLLWLMVTFNIAFADILSLYIPGSTDQLNATGVPIKNLMLFGAIMIQLPLFMIFFSQFLGYQRNKIANLVAVVITALFVILGGSLLPHYLFLASIEILCLLLIFKTTWMWKQTLS